MLRVVASVCTGLYSELNPSVLIRSLLVGIVIISHVLFFSLLQYILDY